MASSDADLPTKVFKILTKEQWAEWDNSGTFKGASIDLRDGYIHLSQAYQVLETYEKFFQDQVGLVLVVVDLTKVTDEIKWEASRHGQLFPHVYGSIDKNAVVKHTDNWQGQKPDI